MKLLALWLWLLPIPALAEQVEAILSSWEIAILPRNEACPAGDMFAIFSQEEGSDPIGFAKILGPTENKQHCRASISSHSRSALIRVGDRIEFIDFTKRNPHLPSRYDLVQDSHKKIAARYKPLVYGGYLYGHTAETLEKKEFLVGIGPLFYGITDRLQVNTVPISLVSNIGVLGLKYKFLELEDMRLSASLEGSKYFATGKGSWSAEILYSSTSNSRSMTHTKLTFISKVPDAAPLENKDQEKQSTAEISTVYEWLLPSWHRILLGPKFTAGEEKDVGFLFTALFLYEHFHWSINLSINSLSKIDLKKNKQVLSFDLFWRL